MPNKNLQKGAMNFGSLIRFYWSHFIAITCVFKIGGIYMSISRRMKWNATTSVLNIMTSNYLSELHFCIKDQSETYFCLRDRSKDFFTQIPPSFIIISNLPLLLVFGKFTTRRLFQTQQLFGTLEYVQ